jgi:hypothetical protein
MAEDQRCVPGIAFQQLLLAGLSEADRAAMERGLQQMEANARALDVTEGE